MKLATKKFCPANLKKKFTKFQKDLSVALKKYKQQIKEDNVIEDEDEDGECSFYDWTDVVDKIAKKWGLVKKRHTGLSNVLYISKKHGFVVKRPWEANYDHPAPRIAIFTKKVAFSLPNDDDNDEELSGPIHLQPLANMKKRYDAMEAIENSRWYDNIGCDYDLHENNVAEYRGEAVAIDW